MALEVAVENHHVSVVASAGTEDEIVNIGAMVVGVTDFPMGVDPITKPTALLDQPTPSSSASPHTNSTA